MDKILNGIVNWINSRDNKVIIGISGHGASGKTTFSKKLMEQLDYKDATYLNTDPYIIGSHLRNHAMIKYEHTGKTHQYKMTACHPAAHQVDALERDIKMMRDGLNFYSIETNYRESTLISSNKRINIVEGMSVAFVNPDLFNLKIYLYTDGDTELARRGVRDVTERGTNIDFLLQSHEERRIQYECFMHPTHRNFDIVIKNSNEEVIVEKNAIIL